MSRINSIPRIDTYLFKIHSNIVPHLRLGLPKDLFPMAREFARPLFYVTLYLMFLNIMFHAPMGRFQLESKLELPLFSRNFYTTRSAEDVSTTKGLQERTQLIEWDDGET